MKRAKFYAAFLRDAFPRIVRLRGENVLVMNG